MMKYVALFLWANLLYVICLTAVFAYDLPQAIQDGLENDPRISKAKNTIESAKTGVIKEESLQKPSITSTQEFGKTYGKMANNTSSTKNNGKNYNIQITAKQNIYSFGRIEHKIDIAKNNIMIAETDLEHMQYKVSLDIVDSYIHLLQSRLTYQIRSDFVQSVQQQLESAEQKFEYEALSINDLRDIRSRYQNALSDQIDAEITLNIAKDVLKLLVKKENIDVNDTSVNSFLHHMPKTIEEAEEKLLQYSPLLQKAQHNIEQHEHLYKLAKAKLYPDVNLEATAKRSRHAQSITQEQKLYLSGNIPIYEGGLLRANIQEAKQNLISAQYDLEHQKMLVLKEIKSRWAEYLGTQKIVEYRQIATQQSEDYYNGVAIEFESGRKSLIDLLDARDKLLESYILYNQSAYTLKKYGANIILLTHNHQFY